MAEPYSDEELAAERGPLCGEDEGPGQWEDRLQATVRRLLAERDAVLADLSQAVNLCEQQSKALNKTLAHCHEARRVARVLAKCICDCDHCAKMYGRARDTALAYPEASHD